MLTIGSQYTRASLETILSMPSLSLTREGIVSRGGRTLLFVTLDKAQQENQQLHYNDFFQGAIFHWDSQTTQHINTPAIKRIVIGDTEVHLFVRIFAKIQGKTQPFIYCGRLLFAEHVPSTKNPAHILYDAIDYESEPNDELRAIYEWSSKSPSKYKLSLDQLIKVPRKSSKGQGFGLSGPQRKAVDLQAMRIAQDALEKMGATEIVDVSKNESRDYKMTFQGHAWSVEVKGTTSEEGTEFFMTKNEKILHEEQQGRTGLIVVSGIALAGTTEKPMASGGRPEVLLPWRIEDWAFEPLTYRVSLKG